MKAAHPLLAQALGRVRMQLPELRADGGPLTVVVACSGGPDSVALLGLLARLARRERLHLHVAHVDHGLRVGSPADAELVRDVAGELDLPVSVHRLELAAGPGIPARARRARRRALVEVARSTGAGVVALGHTATDQAETLLLHLCRGTGPAGLGGMRPLQPWTSADTAGEPSAGVMWRPLLHLDREQTRVLAGAMALPFVDDPTNLDPSHPRVRLRSQVLPQLRAIRDGVDVALARAAALAADADEAIERWAQVELAARRHVARASADATRYSSTGWAELPRAVRRRMIQRVCAGQGVAPDALFERTLVSVDAVLSEPGRGGGPRAWDLHPRRRLRVDSRQFWVEPCQDGPGPPSSHRGPNETGNH